MLDGLENREAIASCVYGYYDGTRLELFRGKLGGTIAERPRGEGGFGWDMLFCPDGYEHKTRAELTQAQNDETYQMIKPIRELREFLRSS
jgi:XTP/dITP diphosphohydrolase